MDDATMRELRAPTNTSGVSFEFEALLANAARYRWLRARNPGAVCAIAWSERAACEHGEPDTAVDAAMRGSYLQRNDTPSPPPAGVPNTLDLRPTVGDERAPTPDKALRAAAERTRGDLGPTGDHYPDVRKLLEFAERAIEDGRA